jgi:hypothetical protein
VDNTLHETHGGHDGLAKKKAGSSDPALFKKIEIYKDKSRSPPPSFISKFVIPVSNKEKNTLKVSFFHKNQNLIEFIPIGQPMGGI